MNKFGKTIGALALVQAFTIAMSTSAATTVQITSGSMEVQEIPDFGAGGAWMLAGQDLSANGSFSNAELPAGYLVIGPVSGSQPMSWTSDSSDGWDGQMVFKGVTYNLTGNTSTESFMDLNANPIDLTHAGSFVEPFTFSAAFCGYLTVPMSFCDTPVNLVGSGMLDLVVTSDPNFPGSFDIQSISYQFAGVPEPGSLALLLTGFVALGLNWRQTNRWSSRRLTNRKLQ